jgi:DNA polymerase II small subunit/DNA polymerase delta subunit B
MGVLHRFSVCNSRYPFAFLVSSLRFPLQGHFSIEMEMKEGSEHAIIFFNSSRGEEWDKTWDEHEFRNGKLKNKKWEQFTLFLDESSLVSSTRSITSTLGSLFLSSILSKSFKEKEWESSMCKFSSQATKIGTEISLTLLWNQRRIRLDLRIKRKRGFHCFFTLERL